MCVVSHGSLLPFALDFLVGANIFTLTDWHMHMHMHTHLGISQPTPKDYQPRGTGLQHATVRYGPHSQYWVSPASPLWMRSPLLLNLCLTPVHCLYRHEIKGEVNTMSQSIVQRNAELAKEITRLQNLLQRLEQKVHGLTERQGTLQQDIQRTTDIFRDDIRKESSFTFWFFFILFQIAFFAAMIFWKRMRDAKNTRYLD